MSAQPSSFFETHIGSPAREFLELDHARRSGVVRERVPDLHVFLGGAVEPGARPAPARTRALAGSLNAALAHADADDAGAARTLVSRIVTDAFLRHEADRDQNVYLGAWFTRTLTQAVPDVVFQPVSLAEVAATFRWARAHGVPVTLRGAGSAAMGGAVPNEGGVVLDLARLDGIEVLEHEGVCVVGAGARLRTIHQRLAAHGRALRAYPSNLGGTLAGWFVTGGIGLNAFGRGRALDSVLAADVVLPGGEHVRLHRDGRIDVPGEGAHRATLPAAGAATWFTGRGYVPFALADLAGSEGVFGVLLHLTVAIEPRQEIGAFLLAFERRDDALAAAAWVARAAGTEFPAPANLEFLSASHMHHVRRVWRDEDVRAWHAAPSSLTDGSGMPWSSITGPAVLGATTAESEHAGGYLFVDFLGLSGARAFAAALAACPGAPCVLERDSVRVARERFRTQQIKRLGPGLLAAEIAMPARHVAAYLARAETLARNAGHELDPEVYFLADGSALVIAGYLTDHRSGAFRLDLPLAPALLDLALADYEGKPYVLGRWQSAYFARRFGADADRIRATRRALDPAELVNRGVLTGLRLRGPLGALLAAALVPAVGLLRRVWQTGATAWIARLARAILSVTPGPASGRGAPASVGATFRAPAPENPATSAPEPARAPAPGAAAPSGGTNARSVLLAVAPGPPAAHVAETQPARPQLADDRALHCVNCGECNSVCPIFHESKIRLPQMLTHLGEAVRGGAALTETGSALLDLCMRCGNCEEVCQAGIPHLPLYDALQRRADAAGLADRERHTAIVAAVRASDRYRDDFLELRGGMYLRRSPASLPGLTRFVVLRSENDAGPASTCIHCGACVPVCPTEANREFEGRDPRWITTVQDRCIGCGTCVEICPANLANGGRTLRVMEAPAPDWFIALAEFDRQLQEKTPIPATS